MAVHKKRMENVYEYYKRTVEQLDNRKDRNKLKKKFNGEMNSMFRLEKRIAVTGQEDSRTAEQSELKI